MNKLSTLTLTGLLAVTSNFVAAADYSDDIHKNDFKWVQFNYMYALEELPRSPNAASGHDYLEMEFGGRSGIVSLYGYVDVFNPTERNSSDKVDSAKMFMKFNPRFSIDAMTGVDMSYGPIKEVYFSTLFNWGGGANDVNNSFWGLGADVEVPWLGTTGMNLYGYYNMSSHDWDGLQFSMNWFKPIHDFDNGSFMAFQGYVDYQFGADTKYTDNVQTQSAHGGQAFFGLYWHSERYGLGYGLKAYNDTYLITDSDGFESTGVSHYFSATYKF